MTQDEIILNRTAVIIMALEAGFSDRYIGGMKYELERFAALVAAHEREKCFDAAMKAAEKAVDTAMLLEREACAKMCDELKWHSPPLNFAENCAAAIRERLVNAKTRGEK